jgi:hypothetical protein
MSDVCVLWESFPTLFFFITTLGLFKSIEIIVWLGQQIRRRT